MNWANNAAALASLELVRARARAGNVLILPQVTTSDKATLRGASGMKEEWNWPWNLTGTST